MKGIREDKWLKPPLYELIEIQQGFKVTHYVFRSIKGGYKRTMMDKDFSLGEWAFCDTPEAYFTLGTAADGRLLGIYRGTAILINSTMGGIGYE